jgi:hypothetical protein
MDKRHNVYNRRDARQPLTALTALQCVPSRPVEFGGPFLAPGVSQPHQHSLR